MKAKKTKVKSRAKAEKERKNKRPERQKERDEWLQRRAKRREEREKSRAESGEPVKVKAKRDLRTHHGAEQVDAAILKLLGKSHRSKKAVGKGKQGVVNKKKVDTLQGTVGTGWKPGTREEAGEGWQQERKLKQKAEAEKSKKKKKTSKLTKTSGIPQAVPIVDEVGPHYADDGVHCRSGDGAVELGWPLKPDYALPSSCEEPPELASPLPDRSPLDPEAFCMKFFQVIKIVIKNNLVSLSLFTAKTSLVHCLHSCLS